ncbi:MULTISPECIES: TonB-dependent receptor [Flavobacteriaceae]|uniref:TonB-dependent receptor n=1 Tax=Flavobacteriaceae TaxID=49546 RepID=UPI00149274CF|nr:MULTISPECIES: TonB-dependent receptor [Allomuricauda]MDC6366790.1 TonB-dependent receptor [Muricauda sp. AC10]
MNKMTNPKPLGRIISLRSYFWTIMRIFLLFIAIGLSSVYANSNYAQTKIDIYVNDVTLEDLFKEIQSKSEYIFFYKDDIINPNERVSLDLKNAKLSQILRKAFSSTDLSYKIDDRQVVVVKKTEKQIQSEDNSVKVEQVSISGTVTDENGDPLPGANVIEKGTTNGTQTDFDGNYTISVGSNAVLMFSYVGFAAKEIPVNGQTTVNVTLMEDASLLEEVVVLGYSTQTRGDLTGSVASVDLSEATKAPLVNAAEALEGRVTGVSVINSGDPGTAPTIRVRGFGSTNANGPLFIIDGVQTTDASILNAINPEDIAQMNVLKDGAASIYGARASNGVVIIATKNGGYNQDSANISLDMYVGFSRASNLPSVLNAQQHGEMIFESLTNDGLTPSHPQYGDGPTPVVPSSIIGAPVPVTTRTSGNWLDDVFGNAPTQNISMSMDNGTERAKYNVSLSYLNREGAQLKSFFRRGLLRANSEFKVGNKIRVGEHLNVSFANSSTPKFRNADLGGNPLSLAQRSSPLLPVRADDGSFAGTYSNALGLSNPTNPVADLTRASDDFYKTIRILGDIYASYEFLDGLTFKTSIGGDLELQNSRQFLATNPEHGEPRTTNTLTEFDYDSYNWIWTNTLNFNKTYGKHSVNVLAGLEAVETRVKQKTINVTGFLFEDPDFYLLDRGSGTPNFGFVGDVTNSLFSVFGSLNYSFDNKYLMTATLRRDSSSNFLGDNRSDIFPAVSAGWLVSAEDWFNTDGIINRFKLKASWGELGNQAVPAANPTINVSNINPAQSNYAFDGSGPTTGAIVGAIGNPDLRWETSESTNIGAEFGFLDSALSFGIEYFKITTNDLIAQDLSVISTTAIDANAPFVNLGNIENTGFDITLGYQNQTDSGFSYGIDVNVSTYKNEVTNLSSDFQVGDTRFRGGAMTRTEVGRPISSFFGLQVDGIFSSESEVSSAPDQGFETAADGVGRFRYRDVNGDDQINDDDRTFIGSPHPDFTYGINLNLGYRNWDFSAFLSGVSGKDAYNYSKIFQDFPTFFNANRSTRVLDSWTPNNTDAILPALSSTIVNNETSPNSYFVEDASYLRLKNIQIGYTLPDSILEKIGVDNIRLYVQASNLFTITDYNGLDPEIPIIIRNGAVDNLTQGVDVSATPLTQIFTFGTNFKF